EVRFELSRFVAQRQFRRRSECDLDRQHSLLLQTKQRRPRLGRLQIVRSRDRELERERIQSHRGRRAGRSTALYRFHAAVRRSQRSRGTIKQQTSACMPTTNPTELATVKGLTVVQNDNGRVHWQSGAAVDADCANGQNNNAFAYRKDDKGLDALANAGYPNQGWRNVLVVDPATGEPKDDGNGNWYSMTTYAWKNRLVENRYVDSTTVPYVVVNPHVRMKAKGVVIGCKARVTYK